MQRFNDTMSADGAFGYLAAGIGSYHFEGQEGPLYWGGELTRQWGLTGLVEREPFYNLCHRCHPHTGEFLGQRKNDRFRSGMDITSNVPKAVTLAALIDPDIYDDIWAANDMMMQAVEDDAKTRVRLQGANRDRPTGNLGFVSGMHFTARQIDGWSDPHAHIHNFVFNLTHDAVEDRIKAAQLGDVKRDGPYYQGIFLNELASRMRATIITDDKEALAEAAEREDRRLLAHDLADYPLSRRRKRLQRGAYLRRLARTHDKAPPIPYKQEPKLAQERLDAAERAHRFRNAIAPRPDGPGEQRGYSR